MTSYRPDTVTISAASTISGSILDVDFNMDSMFVSRTVEYSIDIIINGSTRTIPLIYPGDVNALGIYNATLNRIIP